MRTIIIIALITTSDRGSDVFGRILFGEAGLICGPGTAFHANKQPGKIMRGEYASLFDQNHQDRF